jgi:hypothetical protein
MIKFPKDFPSNIRNIISGFIALNFGAYSLTFLLAHLLEPGFFKEVGLTFIYTLIFMDLFYIWLIMVFIGLFMWHGPLLNKVSKIILIAFLGYSVVVLLFINIFFLRYDKYPYRPKVQAGGGNPPKNFTLVYTDLRRKTEENPMGVLEQKREQAWP